MGKPLGSGSYRPHDAGGKLTFMTTADRFTWNDGDVEIQPAEPKAEDEPAEPDTPKVADFQPGTRLKDPR